MNDKRKPAGVRQKDLRLAISRIQHGRTKTGETKISISAVAREAGVSAALIHNYYPEIAESIREILEISDQSKKNNSQKNLRKEREKNRLLRLEIQELKSKISALASINEVLLLEKLESDESREPEHKVLFPIKKPAKPSA
ncbi:TetR family transcriptional regulator [Pseudomonas moraviensis]|uniref:TetR family transcriptional regulator n=1 Tax=Pseudomonas moraviensis TaxID=321662 RepID=UPI00135E15B7|nr:TetR family transcriptional regulator [Pseudomonas moraviensis]MXI47069.1 TetR family transcriptional regulator [Pseudomonas moraviensis]